MKYNKYIEDAPLVSEIGLGAWQLGNNSGWQNMSEQEAINLVQEALELGINFLDTAPNYGHGTSELRLGKVLKSVNRSDVVINTKFGHTDLGTTNFSSAHIRPSVEGSLKRLQVDYVDSLIIHNPPSAMLDGNQNDHYEILERLVTEGKIKAYGASLDTYEDMKMLMETTNSKVIEAFFNILHQDAARAFSMSLEKKVGIIVKVPLDSGWLSGKYNAASTFNDIRSRWSKQDIKTRALLVDRVKEIMQVEDNLAQKAISFCLAYNAVSTVIPGNVNIEQLRKNASSINHHLTKEMIIKLEDFYANEVKSRLIPW